MRMQQNPTRRRRERGQSLVEFALVLPAFMLLVFGILDGGRAIVAYNDVSQSARNVARVAMVTCFDTAVRCSSASGTPIGDAIADQIGATGPVTWTVTCIDPLDEHHLAELCRRTGRPGQGGRQRDARHAAHRPGPGRDRGGQRHQRSDDQSMNTQGEVTMERPDRAGERGQALPLFVLMLIALLAATGLVVDVGSAWAQERSQQKVADTAALAGATKEANGGLHQAIIDTAMASAVANGYQAAEVQVNIPPTTGKYGPGGAEYSANDCSTAASYPCWVEVVITKPHANFFAGVIGQGSWDVGARGVAVGGIANSVSNALAPIMFNEKAVHKSDRQERQAVLQPAGPQVHARTATSRSTRTSSTGRRSASRAATAT